MPSFETESLVLKSYNLAEADRIVVFFTRDHGVVRGVAKGAKRLKSRFGSTLEPFSTVQLAYFQKDDRELVSIQGVELVTSYFSRASDPEFFHTYSYISELLLAFVPPHDPNETLYRMIEACLTASGAERTDLAPIRLYFEVWLLRLGGYLPDWDRCGDCRRDIFDELNTFLAADFHILCNDCRRSRSLPVVGRNERQVFRKVHKLSPNEFQSFAEEFLPIVEQLSNVMRRIISQVLGKVVSPAMTPKTAAATDSNAI